MPTDHTHECPKPVCKVHIPFSIFACRPHWREVPSDLRTELTGAWRRHPGEDHYFQVRADCLRALGVPDEQIAEMNAGTA